MNSSGQMTQINSGQDKQPIGKNMQQQAILQQQAMQVTIVISFFKFFLKLTLLAPFQFNLLLISFTKIFLDPI